MYQSVAESQRRLVERRTTGSILLIVAALYAAIAPGCSRLTYRNQADREAYDVIAGNLPLNSDPNAHSADYNIEMDPRSRFYENYDLDCPPMPPDDPAAHQYMREVDGMKGWGHWYDNGERQDIENPIWRDALGEYVELNENGDVQLDVNSALRLAYMHSPSHQNQLETLYLTALDVSAQRFQFDTQFFGGYDARYTHNGALAPAGLFFDPSLNRFVVNQPVDGIENNRLLIGRPGTGNPAVQFEKRLATAGEVLAGFANSFVFEFTGGDANLSSSIANFAFIQPLLRGAGRDVALESLTAAERDMLANLRSYGQFRQGLYTQVAIGEVGVAGPQRGGRGTSLQIFSGQGGVGGYVGLLQQLQRIRNTEENLKLQQRTFDQLDAFQKIGVIDLVQVDQFSQSIAAERANLLALRNNFEFSLDQYKTSTLGLPPDLPVVLDDSLIDQFQLVRPEATLIQDQIAELQDRVGNPEYEPSVDEVAAVLDENIRLIQQVRMQLDDIALDIQRMEAKVPDREQTMVEEQDRVQLQIDLEQLANTLLELNTKFDEVANRIHTIKEGLSEETLDDTVKGIVTWLGDVLRIVQRGVLVQARARLESVTVEGIVLDPYDALDIALDNRLDFMNARAALVDSWRQIQVNADALQSVVNLTGSADIRTARNNPLSFRAPTSNVRLGIEFDAPFTRLLERNAYRESLIRYQQSRRGFIQSVDSLHLDLRALLRNIEQLRQNLEIQREAVGIAIRRVDLTRAELNAPVPAPQPGQRSAQFGPTAAQNTLFALSSLRDTQNSFLAAWLSYYASRMRLARELGIMDLDDEGRWMEDLAPESYQRLDANDAEPLEATLGLPPALDLNDPWLRDQLGPVEGFGNHSPNAPIQGPTQNGPPFNQPPFNRNGSHQYPVNQVPNSRTRQNEFDSATVLNREPSAQSYPPRDQSTVGQASSGIRER